MTKVHDDAAPTNHRERSSCACARTSSIRYAPPRATKRAPSLPFRAHTPFSAGMAAHMAVGVAAMPLHALKYTHRRLALPPVCASRLWPSGGAVARPCARCAASRGLWMRFATILTQVAGSVDATRSCAVMVRARRRAGGAVPAGAWAARGRAETASEGRTAPWLAFLALSRVVRFGRWELVSQKWIASGVCQSKALAKPFGSIIYPSNAGLCVFLPNYSGLSTTYRSRSTRTTYQRGPLPRRMRPQSCARPEINRQKHCPRCPTPGARAPRV